MFTKGPSHNKRCVKSHFFLEHFKSVPDGQRLNIVVAHTGSVGTESVGPFLRLNSAMAHVDVGPPCSCLHPRIKCDMEKWIPIGEPGPGRSLCAPGPRFGSFRAPGGRTALSGLKIVFSRYSYARNTLKTSISPGNVGIA